MVEEWEKDLREELNDPKFARAYGAECARSEFGLALLNARQKCKLTQKQLSGKLGIRQPYIAQLESGEANPTLSTAGRILASLGLKLVVTTTPLTPDIEPFYGKTNTKQVSLVAEKKAKYSK